MGNLIDWELLSQLLTPPGFAQAPMWDAFADRYNGYVAMQADHARLQVELMEITADDTVLDVGAGPGRLSIPAAARARSVTALDVSPLMLERLERNARNRGCDNIRTLNLDWADVRPGENVEIHDIVVASRSPATRDLAKINALARKRAYIMTFSGPSLKDFHDSLVAGIADTPPPAARPFAMPAHALTFNRLTTMGLEVNVRFIPDGFRAVFADWRDLFESFGWLGIAKADETRFRENIAPYLSETETGTELCMETRTVVMWWDKTGSPVLGNMPQQ